MTNPNSPAVEAAEREAFKAWAMPQGIDCALWLPNQPQVGYNNERTNDYWRGWLGRAALSQQEVAAPVGDALINKVRQEWNDAQPEHNRWENLTERSRLLLVAKAASRVPAANIPDTAPMYKALTEARIALSAHASGAGIRAIALIDKVLNATPEQGRAAS